MHVVYNIYFLKQCKQPFVSREREGNGHYAAAQIFFRLKMRSPWRASWLSAVIGSRHLPFMMLSLAHPFFFPLSHSHARLMSVFSVALALLVPVDRCSTSIGSTETVVVSLCSNQADSVGDTARVSLDIAVINCAINAIMRESQS